MGDQDGDLVKASQYADLLFILVETKGLVISGSRLVFVGGPASTSSGRRATRRR